MAVQTFDVARLTTHAIPIVAGTFIAVSGVGPKSDSNGSGKTSFLAAVTVLLADPQWRLDVNGGQLASGLLFKPDAAGVDEARFAAPGHGYIVGLFAEPHDPAGTDIPLLTVWVKLASRSPYLQVRWCYGMHVADGETDEIRYSQADEIWASLGAVNQSSARQMQETLYGDAPRCMAYLDTTLRRASVSLLSQQMTEMTTDAIGSSLIELAGLHHFLEDEQAQRNALAEQQRGAEQAQADHHRRWQEEEAELAGISNRKKSRERLAYGREMWRLHFARRYVDLVPEHVAAKQAVKAAEESVQQTDGARRAAEETHRILALRRDLADTERVAREEWSARTEARETNDTEHAVLSNNLANVNNQRTALLVVADGWDGTSVQDAELILREASGREAGAKSDLGIAQSAHAARVTELRQAEEGVSTDTVSILERLTDEGLSGAAFADVVTIEDHAREKWEPLLWSLRSAVVIEHGDEERAAAAVSTLPGSVFVSADDPDSPNPLPDGVTATLPVGGLLAVLADRHEHHLEPDRAVDAHAAIATIGGFEASFLGRASRIAAARLKVDAADRVVRQEREKFGASQRAVRSADAALERAKAAARLSELDAERARLSTLVEERVARADVLGAEEEAAFTNWQAAHDLAQNHSTSVALAKSVADKANREFEMAKREQKSAQQALEDLRLPYWETGWGATLEEAHDLLSRQDEQTRRLTSKRLRNRAQEALKEALDAYCADAPEVPADIKRVIERREDLADGEDATSGSVSFEELSQPLHNRLLGSSERDLITENTIRRERSRRDATIRDLGREVDERTGALQALQDMIESSIEGHFASMSQALNRLDLVRGGAGAELEVVSRRPETATGRWHWEVSPRWRRSPGGKMISYREVANGAQVKVYAVQVTLAALLAAEDPGARVLVIDELGNSLGEVNRKDVLRALRQVAEEQGVTIFGTCQDSVLHDAAEACQEILWFTHAALTDAYNQPVRIWAHDAEQRRVEVTADWVRSGRPWV
ncbi:hypothetical protein [Amycolatopsis dongchuanensis]|uniref:hypothetical protein n=1 Tax=Amycolatopsis TaxID=1813 RepID=UPI0031F87C9C